MPIIDLRSDTVTLPSQEMRRAMSEAELGDDDRGEDPTVNRLETMAAEMLGKESAVLVSSGTQGNLVAILSHAQRGDEIIVGERSHIFRAEGGGASALGGVSYHVLKNDQRGMLNPIEIEKAIRDPDNVHHPRTTMVALENTANSCGGSPLTQEDTKVIADVAHRHNIALHIDGARIFNAAVALETPVSELTRDADSITFCLSKGLSGPVGSLLCGSNEFIELARRWRKVLGGQMRQAGIIAAAGIVCLENMIERLAEDHANARKLAKGLMGIPGLEVDTNNPETNLVYVQVTDGDPVELSRKLAEQGILCGKPERQWRLVTHYGITSSDIDQTINVIESTFKEYAKA